MAPDGSFCLVPPALTEYRSPQVVQSHTLKLQMRVAPAILCMVLAAGCCGRAATPASRGDVPGPRPVPAPECGTAFVARDSVITQYSGKADARIKPSTNGVPEIVVDAFPGERPVPQ